MEVRLDASTPNSALVELTLDELVILNNALNEACNGLDLQEFATRMGAQRDDALWLLREVGDAIAAIDAEARGLN